MRVAVALFLLAAAVPQDDATFSAALRRLAAPSPAVTGVAIMHLPSGRTASLNGAQRFPMMSVYKLPIVVHALRRAEAGTLDVGERVTMTADDRRPGRSRLSEQIAAEGPVTLTVRDLLERIVRESDNAASDRVLRIVGGPNAVAETLRSLRIEGIDVSRYELEFAADYYGVCCLDKLKPYTLERFFDAVEAVPPGGAARQRRRISVIGGIQLRRGGWRRWRRGC